MRFEQSFYEAVGKWACYALCICHLAEKITGRQTDHVMDIRKGITMGYIKWNDDDYSDPDNMTVLRPDLFLGMLAGGRWSVEKVRGAYAAKDGELCVQYWTRGGYGHFICEDYNSLQKSKCVSQGVLDSCRVFRRIG